MCSALEQLHQEQLGSGGQEGTRAAVVAGLVGLCCGLFEREVGWIWHLNFLD